MIVHAREPELRRAGGLAAQPEPEPEPEVAYLGRARGTLCFFLGVAR